MLELNKNPDELLLQWVVRMPDDKADEILVDVVVFEMRNKLAKKRAGGRGGWHGPNCSNAKLHKMLMEHVLKGDPIDVINIAAMMMARRKLYGESA